MKPDMRFPSRQKRSEYLSRARGVPCTLSNSHHGPYYLDLLHIKRRRLWGAMTYPRSFNRCQSQDLNADMFVSKLKVRIAANNLQRQVSQI